MKKRLAFARNYFNMPLAFWKNIVWSDESKFELRQLKKKHQVWRKKMRRIKKHLLHPQLNLAADD